MTGLPDPVLTGEKTFEQNNFEMLYCIHHTPLKSVFFAFLLKSLRGGEEQGTVCFKMVQRERTDESRVYLITGSDCDSGELGYQLCHQ